MRKKFNSEYFNLWKEPLLLSSLWLSSFWSTREGVRNDSILVAVPCLIGEFMVAIPAIRDFISRHPDKKVDLLVTPGLKSLAERVIGIRSVYTTASVYEGNKEGGKGYNEPFGEYEEIVMLRTSSVTNRLLKRVSASRIRTNTLILLRYSLHLVWCLLVGSTPKRWRTVNFEMLGGVDSDVPFEKLFKFNVDDYKRCEELLPQEDGSKRIIVHTASTWSGKNWHKDRWHMLLEKIRSAGNFHFIFVGSEGDSEVYSYVASRASFAVYSLVQKVSLAELPLLFKKADYFIGVDSGPSNLAHLVGLPNVTMFGISPNMYLSPRDKDITIDKTGGRAIHDLFFYRERNSMSKISVEDAYAAFMSLHARHQLR